MNKEYKEICVNCKEEFTTNTNFDTEGVIDRRKNIFCSLKYKYYSKVFYFLIYCKYTRIKKFKK